MNECSFCKKEFPDGTGIMYIKEDGTILYFCSSKCEKNMVKLKRVNTNVRWSDAFHKKRGVKRG